MEKEIDIVITWVDGNDLEWQKERNQYCEGDSSFHMRYRDWDNVQYIFRGIEKYMPWVRKVHFVTWGHTPKWLNLQHPKLNVVKHEEFIPAKYLPTFNSSVIQLNIHRISGLAEHFINFNDDMFVIKKTNPEDFFQDGLPKDMAVISPQPIFRNKIVNIETNNLEIINDYFSINDVKKNWSKWICPIKYGTHVLRTLFFLQFSTIIGVFVHHIPYSYNKKIIEEIWEKEYDALDKVGYEKFRSVNDLSEWLFREWQLLSGQFIPRTKKFGILIPAADIKTVKKVLHDSKYKMVCINDGETVNDFASIKESVNIELNKLFPEKSSYEI